MTGDKLETAESIGYSSRLLTHEMQVIKIRAEEDVLNFFTKKNALENEMIIMNGCKRALLIEADALKFVLETDDGQISDQTRWFLKMSRTMETVICCRVSPS